MRRSLALLLAFVVLAGCSKPTPAPPPPLPKPEAESRPTPLPDGPTPPPPELPPPPLRTDLPITAIYRDVQAGYGKKPAIPAFENVCKPTEGDAPLTGAIRALDWERYPGLTPTLWVPVVTIDLCNPGPLLPKGWARIKLSGGYAFTGEENLQLPVLDRGAGTGPLKVYLPTGLPASLFQLVEAKALPWPEITVQVSYQATDGGPNQVVAEQRLTVPPGEEGVSITEWRLPEQPSPMLLRAADWTGRRIWVTGGDELFLYGPEIRYQVVDLIGCNPPGGLAALSPDWSLWSLAENGSLRREGSLGDRVFPGSYTWSIEERPEVRSTFLLLHYPNSCHFPGGAVIWHYDLMTGALERPTITVGDESYPANAPTPTIEADGGLHTYDLRNLGEESPWNKVTYRWDRQRLNWSLPAGPTGAPSAPGEVYRTNP